jgi:uncharacterized protein YecT (DUF1311 family)
MIHMRVVLVAVLLFAAPRAAPAAPPQCKSPANLVLATICASPTLTARDAEIAQRYGKLHAACSAEQDKVFSATQRFWLRERSNCQVMAGEPGQHVSVAACLADVMESRLDQLRKMGARCDVDRVAADLRRVDPWYLNKYQDRYVGKKVSVFGQIALARCDTPGAPAVSGFVLGTGRSPEKIAVVFKAMPPRELAFLCKSPVSQWSGEMRRDGSGTYLYLSDVLGSPL